MAGTSCAFENVFAVFLTLAHGRQQHPPPPAVVITKPLSCWVLLVEKRPSGSHERDADTWF